MIFLIFFWRTPIWRTFGSRILGGFVAFASWIFYGNVYIVVVTIDMLMVTERNDTVIRISKWLDRAVEGYISDRKVKVKFPSKRNFVDTAVMQLLEERGVKLK